MIDVHMLHMPDENKQWLKRCEESLVNESINIYHLDGIQGNIKKSRLMGFQQGSSPYVSFVDPDDYILQGAFEKCLLGITHDVCGVYTSFYRVNDYATSLVTPRKCYDIHQLVVMHRQDVLEAFEKYYNEIPDNGGNEFYLYSAMNEKKKWKHIDFDGYVWRKHSKGIHNKYTSTYYADLIKKIEHDFPKSSVEYILPTV